MGLIVVILTVAVGVAFAIVSWHVSSYVKSKAVYDEAGECIHDQGDVCPFQELNKFSIYGYIITGLLFLFFGLGIYLLFFEKSQEILQKTQETITKDLKESRKKDVEEERFNTLLKGLDEDERKAITAVREQDGISQSTLRLRTEMSKSKLSIVLKGLEKKELITKVPEGKINRIYMKRAI